MRVKVVININEEDATKLRFTEDVEQPQESNISNSEEIFDEYANGYKGFQLAKYYKQYPSLLDGSYKLFPATGYNGFVSSDSTDIDGNFLASQVFHIHLFGNAPQYLYIVFDPETKSYAKNFDIQYGQRIISIKNNTSPYVIISLENLMFETSFVDTDIILTFNDYNQPYSSLKITKIATQYVAVYTGKDLISFKCSENSSNSSIKVTPGIIEQYADIKIYDRDNALHLMAQQDLLKLGKSVTITAIDLDGKSYSLGAYLIDTYDINSNSAIVNVSCSDRIQDLDKIRVQAVELSFLRNLHSMLSFLFTKMNNAAWRYIDNDTWSYCESIVTPNSWFAASTLKELAGKICTLGMLSIYCVSNIYVVARCW